MIDHDHDEKYSDSDKQKENAMRYELDKLNALVSRYLEGNADVQLLDDLTKATPEAYISYSNQSGYFVSMTNKGPICDRKKTLAAALGYTPCELAFNGDESCFELVSDLIAKQLKPLEI